MWHNEYFTDINGISHDVGEYKLLEPYARQIVFETIGKPVYFKPHPVITLENSNPTISPPTPPTLSRKHNYLEKRDDSQLSLSLSTPLSNSFASYSSNNKELSLPDAMSINTNIIKDVKREQARL